MSKRKFEEFQQEIEADKQFLIDLEGVKHQHTLDSDESDQEDESWVWKWINQSIKSINHAIYSNPVHHMNPDDIEGEEAGETFVNAEEEVKFTPFNMKEELEEVWFQDFISSHLSWGLKKS